MLLLKKKHSFLDRKIFPDISTIRQDFILVYCPICEELSMKELGYFDFEEDFEDIIKEKNIKFIIKLCFSCYDDDESEYYEDNVDDDGDCPYDILCYNQYMNLVHVEHRDYLKDR